MGVLCGPGEEDRFEGKAQLLIKEEFTCIREAVAALNTQEGFKACPEGFCIVFVKRTKLYSLLYRPDKGWRLCSFSDLRVARMITYLLLVEMCRPRLAPLGYRMAMLSQNIVTCIILAVAMCQMT